MSDRLDDLRERVAANDRHIVEAVNARLRLVDELWRLKAELGLERLDRGRERALRAELQEANAGPLSQHGLEQLVNDILALTKRELTSPDDAA